MGARKIAGFVVLILGGLGLIRVLLATGHGQNSGSYLVGGLTGGVGFILFGVWLVRSGESKVRR